MASDQKGEGGETVKAAAEEGETVAAEDKGKEKVTEAAEEGETVAAEDKGMEKIDMPLAAAMLSTVIGNSCKIVDDESNSDKPSGDGEIIMVKLPDQVPSTIFPEVKKYCMKHAKVDEKGNSTATVFTNTGAAAVAAAASSSSTSVPNYDPIATEEEELKNWDKEFVNVDQWSLYNLLLAAHFLEIKGLLDIASQKVADMLKGKNSQEMRDTLNIANDFTADEQQAIAALNPWAFPNPNPLPLPHPE
uniref:SKP1 component dimerisation domain-containing protein n=1 Tax=Oryza punctata TaxID=4537 RepID=A0A0E0LJM3_ORYPU